MTQAQPAKRPIASSSRTEPRGCDGAPPGTFSSLGVPAFRWFWLANVGFFAAMQMQTVAQGWLVYEMTGDALMLGGISAGQGISMLACSLFGGVLADRVVKRDLLIATQVALAGIALSLGVLIAAGLIQYWHLMVGAVVSGAVFAFNMPARQALVAELVSDRQLANAVAINASGVNLMRMAGPAVAGLLLEALGAAGVYFAMVGCYTFVVASMLLVPRIAVRPRQSPGSVVGDLREAAVYLRRTPVVTMLIAAEFVLVLVGMPYQMLLPVFARDVHQVGPGGLGGLLSAVGIGALVGSLAVAALARLPFRGVMLLGSGVVFGVGLLGFAAASSYVVALACLVIVGIGNNAYFALNNGLVMGIVTPAMRGRVMSVYAFTFGLQPLGTMPLSAIAAALGAPVAVGIGGAVLAAAMSSLAAVKPTIRRLA